MRRIAVWVTAVIGFGCDNPPRADRAPVLAGDSALDRAAPSSSLTDVIAEKASTVWYCVDGRWIELGGGD